MPNIFGVLRQSNLFPKMNDTKENVPLLGGFNPGKPYTRCNKHVSFGFGICGLIIGVVGLGLLIMSFVIKSVTVGVVSTCCVGLSAAIIMYITFRTVDETELRTQITDYDDV